jgi:hypothetical protein
MKYVAIKASRGIFRRLMAPTFQQAQPQQLQLCWISPSALSTK